MYRIEKCVNQWRWEPCGSEFATQQLAEEEMQRIKRWRRFADPLRVVEVPQPQPSSLTPEMLSEEDVRMLDALRMNQYDPNKIRDDDERQTVFKALDWADRLLGSPNTGEG